MSTLIVVTVVLLALVAAGSIIFIAWQLTSRETQEALERALGREDPAPPEAAGGNPEPVEKQSD